MEMEMEMETSKETEIKASELFKAAELGNTSLFSSFSKDQLAKFLSFRNDDGRSLLHVAASSAQSKVLIKFFFIFRVGLFIFE